MSNQYPTHQRVVQVPVEHVYHQDVNPVVAQAVEPSHWSKWWWLPLLLLGLLGATLWHGCHTTRVAPIQTEVIHTTVVQTHAAPAETHTVTEAVETHTITEPAETITVHGEVTQAQAEQIALSHVGEGTVTHAGPETDHGAMWEIEVTRPNGQEVDVYVAADGTVVHTVNR